VPGFGDSCRPPTASSPARPGQASPGRFPGRWGAGTRAPGPADGRLQPRWPLLSPSRSRCTSPASVGLYTSGEPLLPGLRRAVNPTPLPGCTRRIDHSGKATLTRANSAAGGRLTRHRPPVSQPARHRGSHGAAHPGQPPRPSRPPPPPAPPSAGRFGADAVIPGACLENARTPRGVTCACCRFFSHGHRPGSTTRQKCAGSLPNTRSFTHAIGRLAPCADCLFCCLLDGRETSRTAAAGGLWGSWRGSGRGDRRGPMACSCIRS
jgi:hypothetical protein